MENTPILHPKFWSEEIWLECAKVEREFLFLTIKEEMIVVRLSSRTSFNLTVEGFSLLSHFTALLELGTSEHFTMAMEVKKILLRMYPADMVDQVEQETLDYLIPELIQ